MNFCYLCCHYSCHPCVLHHDCWCMICLFCKLTQFKFSVDFLLKLCFLTVWSKYLLLICLISFFQTFSFFCYKINTEITWREWEAFWQSYREVTIRKCSTGCSQVFFMLFCHALCYELVHFQLFCSFFGLPSCMWKGPKIHVTFCCVYNVCRIACGNSLLIIGNNKISTKIYNWDFTKKWFDPYHSFLMVSSIYANWNGSNHFFVKSQL